MFQRVPLWETQLFLVHLGTLFQHQGSLDLQGSCLPSMFNVSLMLSRASFSASMACILKRY
jgi:hypothetical protein